MGIYAFLNHGLIPLSSFFVQAISDFNFVFRQALPKRPFSHTDVDVLSHVEGASLVRKPNYTRHGVGSQGI